MDLPSLRKLAVEARDFKWEPCADYCTWMDNPHGPCSCGSQKRDEERQRTFKRELGPATVIDLIDRILGD